MDVFEVVIALLLGGAALAALARRVGAPYPALVALAGAALALVPGAPTLVLDPELALALFVGMAAGAYSSIFIATPLVVQLKELEPGVRAGDARTMRHRDRREVDRYASVPAFREDMPLHDEPGGATSVAVLDAEDELDDDARVPAAPVRTPRSTAGERPASRSVSPSASAKRAQPSRKPRSQRGKR